MFKVIRTFKGAQEGQKVVSKNIDSCSTLYREGYYIIYGFLENNYLNTSYCSLNEKLDLVKYGLKENEDENKVHHFLNHEIDHLNKHIEVLSSLADRKTTRVAYLMAITTAFFLVGFILRRYFNT